MAKIKVILEVDEEKVREISENADLEDAITKELGWLCDSGMAVESWEIVEQ